MPVIKIQVRNKVPKVISQTPLPEGWKDPRFVVCYNGWDDEDTYTVEWDLDEEWTKFEHLTMHVSFSDDTSTDVLFKGNTCTLPPILSPGNTYIGLYAGNIHSTIPAKLYARRSTLNKGGFPPKTDAYLDVLKELEGKLNKNQGAENAQKPLVVDKNGNAVPQEGSIVPVMSTDTKGKYLINDGNEPQWADVEALPIMSADTASNVLTNDGKEAYWRPSVYSSGYYFYQENNHDDDVIGAFYKGNKGFVVTGMALPMEVPVNVLIGAVNRGFVDLTCIDVKGGVWSSAINLRNNTVGTPTRMYDVLRVNLTTDDNGNWSVDKEWDGASSVIERGGLVYATDESGNVYALRSFVSAEHIIFFATNIKDTKGALQPAYTALVWLADGTIVGENAVISAVSYDANQDLSADEQAQARANIGLTPAAKTDNMTQSVGLDAETGELWTKPGSDKSLGITSATVGQILQVSEVDADGNPTKWDVLDTTEATLVETIEGQVAAQTAEVT